VINLEPTIIYSLAVYNFLSTAGGRLLTVSKKPRKLATAFWAIIYPDKKMKHLKPRGDIS
jgi:hypothetical protein